MSDHENDRAARATKGSPFLSAQRAAYYLGISPRTLQQYRSAGTGPAFRRHSRRICYYIDDLDAWSKASGKTDA